MQILFWKYVIDHRYGQNLETGLENQEYTIKVEKDDYKRTIIEAFREANFRSLDTIFLGYSHETEEINKMWLGKSTIEDHRLKILKVKFEKVSP